MVFVCFYFPNGTSTRNGESIKVVFSFFLGGEGSCSKSKSISMDHNSVIYFTRDGFRSFKVYTHMYVYIYKFIHTPQ